MKRNVTIGIALAILVVGGMVHGSWGERWNSSTILGDAAVRVAKVPLEIGAWKGQDMDTDAAAFFQAGAQKYWTRSYVHSGNKTALLVILMCGRPGRMAVHTPDICYRGAGYGMGGKQEALVIRSAGGDDLGTFWTARFSKETSVASDLRLYWSWNGGELWQASSNPRWDFGGQPFLYKLYLSHDAPASAEVSIAAVRGFLSEFLPELHKTLLTRTP